MAGLNVGDEHRPPTRRDSNHAVWRHAWHGHLDRRGKTQFGRR